MAKYNFKGIQKLGAVGLRTALASSPWTAWTLKGGNLTNAIIEFLVNLAANKGLILLNVGAIYVEGEFDAKAMDRAMDKAFSEILNAGGADKLTPAQIKKIDDEVIKAARQFIVFGNR